MLPAMRATIPRMGQGLPDKHRAANTIRQGVPNVGSPEPDRPLALTASRNRPALGASSKGSDSGSRAQSNRAGWPGWVREGGTLFLIRCSKRRNGDAVGGGPCPQRDRTRISKRPEGEKSLHKCALVLYRPMGNCLTLPRQCSIQPKDVLNFLRDRKSVV